MTIPCQAYLLARAAEGMKCDFAHGDALCNITAESGLLRLELRAEGYLISNEWYVFADEMQTAVSYAH